MRGLRIKGKNRSGTEGRDHSSINYDFDELFAPISHLFLNYYWILDDVNFNYKASLDEYFCDDNNYDKLFLAEKEFHVRLSAKGFLNSYSKYIQGDWDDIIGINNLDYFSKYGSCGKWVFVEQYADIYFSCIDAAYWEIYLRDFELLENIKAIFPCSVECELKDKQY